MNRQLHLWVSALAVLGMALPWVNPFALGPSPPVIQGLVTWLGVALVLCALQIQPQKSDIASLSAAAWLLAGLLSSCMALLQYFGMGEHGAPWINTTVLGEAYANLRQRNQFATLTNISLLALLHAVAKWNMPTRPAGEFLCFIGAAVLLSLGNVASSSRTGMVQLILIVGLAAVWGHLREPKLRQVLLSAVLAYCAGALLLPWLAGLDPMGHGILGRLNGDIPACGSRLTLWSNVIYLISQKPWLGWGWGELDFAHFMTLYPGARFCDILDNAHNLPLHLAVELGLPLAILSIAVGLFLLLRGRPWLERDAGRQMAWGVLAVILLHSMLEYPLWYAPFQVASGLCVVLLWNSRNPSAAQKQWRSPVHRAMALSVASVLVTAVGYVAWDYTRVSQIYMPPDERLPAYKDNTLEKIRDSGLFHDQVEFAELTTTPLTLENAGNIYAMAKKMLHFSPEARVAERLIESATLLGRQQEAVFYLARFRAAFPQDYARWSTDPRKRSSSAVGP